jgi:hypothetical protein
MLAQPVSDFLSNSAALCDAVLRLRGHALTEELGRIVRAVLNSPLGEYVPADSPRCCCRRRWTRRCSQR